jgi:hypothetical protein
VNSINEFARHYLDGSLEFSGFTNDNFLYVRHFPEKAYVHT